MGVDLSDDFDFHDHFKGFDDDFFKKHHNFERQWFGTMELVITLVLVVAIIVVLILILCRCCSRDKYRGQVIVAPPPDGATAAPYPRQQYNPPAMTSATMVQSPYPAAPYPGAYPAHAAPYPAAYPHAMPAPVPAPAPYPTAYPHPQPQPQPQPALAPSAPDANALPPSYEQATSAEFKHTSPYNPGY